MVYHVIAAESLTCTGFGSLELCQYLRRYPTRVREPVSVGGDHDTSSLPRLPGMTLREAGAPGRSVAEGSPEPVAASDVPPSLVAVRRTE
jgi:hypothetical protein